MKFQNSKIRQEFYTSRATSGISERMPHKNVNKVDVEAGSDVTQTSRCHT